MDIQNLVRERVIGNIKTGMKGENGIPQKLSYFHVEEDKGTSYDMVEIFKKLYPGKPTKLKIRFTSENPFNFKFKRYVNGKAACIGNGTKAITVGKDARNNNTQIEIECHEGCQHRQSGKCKLKGSLKFVLEGISAGGVWNLSTSGGISLSNIASEIVKYKKAGMSIVDVPFELTLTEQQSLAYGTYYSIDLHRTDIKPQLIEASNAQLNTTNESKQLLAITINSDSRYKIRDYAIICIFLNCSLRLSELIGINLTDLKIDNSEQTLKVTGKGNKQRIIYLNAAVCEAIKAYLEVRPKIDKSNRDYNALFISSQQKRISKRPVQNIIKTKLIELLETLGKDNEKYYTHTLRHSGATLLYNEADADIFVLKLILGHASIEATQVYTHVSDKKLKEFMQNFNILDRKE